ncbi:MAG TPA: hypothetical protein VM145_00270 [Sphingomicrobium sp.]|nr:hypothetical protein [Sphingomicrobium sp.]
MRRVWGILFAGTALVAGAAAEAQSSGELTIYSKGHFKGPSLGLAGPLTHIDPPFTAKSVQLSPGSAWEICSGNTFTGCKRLDKSDEAMVFAVRSARPIAPVISTRVGPGITQGPGGTIELPNQSLRGLASEFFVAPNQGGQRVGIPENKPENMRKAADTFCQAAGWRQSVHARVQQSGATYYLVDVLCSNDAG